MPTSENYTLIMITWRKSLKVPLAG